jgi:hypothetical protein
VFAEDQERFDVFSIPVCVVGEHLCRVPNRRPTPEATKDVPRLMYAAG